MHRVVSLLFIWMVGAQSAGAIEWPKDLNSVLAANRIDIKVIETLVLQTLRSDVPAKVADFRFVPLETNSRIDLIASVDFSGGRGFNYFVAVWQSPGGYGSAVLASYGNSLAADVLDLDRTGVYRVVASEVPGGYQGAFTMPIPWYAVYTLTDGKWTNVSDRYPHFSRLDSGSYRLAEACAAGNRDLVELYRDNALFVRFKFNRMVMHERDAGLETALQWANSPTHNTQLLAVETLREINDPRAIAEIRKLADGPDSGVRIFAKDALAHLGAPGHKK